MLDWPVSPKCLAGKQCITAKFVIGASWITKGKDYCYDKHTLSLSFVSSGQQLSADREMRHRITCKKGGEFVKGNIKFVHPFVESGFVLSCAGLLKHNGLIGSVASFTLRDCVSACTLRFFASPRTLRFVAYRYALFRNNSGV